MKKRRNKYEKALDVAIKYPSPTNIRTLTELLENSFRVMVPRRRAETLVFTAIGRIHKGEVKKTDILKAIKLSVEDIGEALNEEFEYLDLHGELEAERVLEIIDYTSTVQDIINSLAKEMEKN